MISGTAPCFSNTSEPESMIHSPSQLYHDALEASFGGGDAGSETQLRSIICSLSLLKQKVIEVESLVSILMSQQSPHNGQPASTLSTSSIPFASLGTLIQEVVVTASSMMFNCQQMTIGSSQTGSHPLAEDQHHIKQQRPPDDRLSQFVGCGIGKTDTNQFFLDGEGLYNWYNNDNSTCNNNYINLRPDSSSRTTTTVTTMVKAENSMCTQAKTGSKLALNRKSLSEAYDLVEPDAEDLLAKYTHYCQVCGKGFKRDANLRMHMRAHGDEYKSTAALSNPLKKDTIDKNDGTKPPRKYSCPHQGCRWNKNHAKFQPLKSIICVKNHYKRSHCPKMYVCKRCTRKEFSVLSDLKTHEKHCGDRKWQCSCGTNFSRKDKLMGHVALFVGHSPSISPLGIGDNKLDNRGDMQIQFEDR